MGYPTPNQIKERIRIMTKVLTVILLIAVAGCNIPDVVIDAQDELAMEFDRGHCAATNYFSTFEAEYDTPPLCTDWSIYHFIDSFDIPLMEYDWQSEFDYRRLTSYHFGVIQAMKDWR